MHRRDIQGLRAAAVGLVILGHLGIPFVPGGFIGVDVFFVLSGFLITGLLLEEALGPDRVSLVRFYARRARRILPAATVVLVATLAATALLEGVARTETAGTDALWAAFFLANVHMAEVGTDYWAGSAPSPFQHYWSLAVEEQFYLLWPLLIGAVAPKVTPRVLAVVFGAVVVASLLWSAHITGEAPAAAYFSSAARAHELALGGLLALAGYAGWQLPRAVRPAVGLAGAGVLLWCAFFFAEGEPFPGLRALVPVLACVALLAAHPSRVPGVSAVLELRPVQYLGDISFSLYLWHWPVIVLLEKRLRLEMPAAVAVLVMFALTVALASASYHFVEQPFRRGHFLGLRHNRRALALWPATLALLLVSITASTSYSSAVAEREDREAREYFAKHPEALAGVEGTDVEEALANAVAQARKGAPLPPGFDLAEQATNVWHKQKRYSCAAWWKESTVRICPVGDLDAERTVALFGDSHAGMWLPTLDDLGKEHGFRVVPYLKHGCGPYDVPQGGDLVPLEVCNAFHDWATDQIRDLRPDAIVVNGRGLWTVSPADGKSLEATWTDGVHRTVDGLDELAAQVYVLGDVPSRPQDAGDCMSGVGNRAEDCLAKVASPETRSNPLTRTALEGTRATFVDVVPLVCSDRACPLTVGEDIVYFDDDHISLDWSHLVAARLGEELTGLLG